MQNDIFRESLFAHGEQLVGMHAGEIYENYQGLIGYYYQQRDAFETLEHKINDQAQKIANAKAEISALFAEAKAGLHKTFNGKYPTVHQDELLYCQTSYYMDKRIDNIYHEDFQFKLPTRKADISKQLQKLAKKNYLPGVYRYAQEGCTGIQELLLAYDDNLPGSQEKLDALIYAAKAGFVPAQVKVGIGAINCILRGENLENMTTTPGWQYVLSHPAWAAEGNAPHHENTFKMFRQWVLEGCTKHGNHEAISYIEKIKDTGETLLRRYFDFNAYPFEIKPEWLKADLLSPGIKAAFLSEYNNYDERLGERVHLNQILSKIIELKDNLAIVAQKLQPEDSKRLQSLQNMVLPIWQEWHQSRLPICNMIFQTDHFSADINKDVAKYLYTGLNRIDQMSLEGQVMEEQFHLLRAFKMILQNLQHRKDVEMINILKVWRDINKGVAQGGEYLEVGESEFEPLATTSPMMQLAPEGILAPLQIANA